MFQPPTPTRPSARGFTLIELMITVAVVAILAAVALPAYNESVRKSRRSEGIAALMAVQQAQERWRANNAAYASDVADLNQPALTPSGYYGIAIEEDSATGTGYIVTATAKDGTSQAADSLCVKLSVQMNGGNLSYAGGSGDLNYTATHPCFAK